MLAVANMILCETTLSFIGLGLKAPVVSCGLLLTSAQNFRTVGHSRWRLIPVLFVSPPWSRSCSSATGSARPLTTASSTLVADQEVFRSDMSSGADWRPRACSNPSRDGVRNVIES